MLILYCIWNLFNVGLADHAIYLSTIEVTIEQFQITTEIKVFEDDLRDAIRGAYDYPVDTASNNFINLVADYFNDHVQIFDGAYLIKFRPESIERVGDSYRFKAKADVKVTPIDLNFSIDYFLELFPVQQNVLHLKIGAQKWFHIFKKGKEDLSISTTP